MRRNHPLNPSNIEKTTKNTCGSSTGQAHESRSILDKGPDRVRRKCCATLLASKIELGVTKIGYSVIHIAQWSENALAPVLQSHDVKHQAALPAFRRSLYAPRRQLREVSFLAGATLRMAVHMPTTCAQRGTCQHFPLVILRTARSRARGRGRRASNFNSAWPA